MKLQGSFTDSSRLYMLQGGISQQEWRVSELLFRLLNLLRPYLNHPYQNMRDRLGSVLTNIFLHDIDLPGGMVSSSPRVKDFVDEILPQLSLLLDNGNRDSPVSGSHPVANCFQCLFVVFLLGNRLTGIQSKATKNATNLYVC